MIIHTRFAPLVALLLGLAAAGCQSTVFHSTVPPAQRVSVLVSNEPLERGAYEVKGFVVAERVNYFPDAWGLVKGKESALSDVFYDDIRGELYARAESLDANALVDVRVINYEYHSGCGVFSAWVPFGYARMTLQATAIRLLDPQAGPVEVEAEAAHSP